MPSLATLFRLAAALDISVQDLLPPTGAGTVTVVRSAPSTTLRMHESPGAPEGRLLVSDPQFLMEVIEYRLPAGGPENDWFEHEGEDFLHVREGSMLVEFAGGRTEVLQPGDMLHHDSRLAHRWSAVGGTDVVVLLISARLRTGERHPKEVRQTPET